MKILKYPKFEKHKFRCKSKCKCGLKVRITDISETVYIKPNMEHIVLFDPDITFGWVCPNCRNTNELTSFQSWRICKNIIHSGIDLKFYRILCNSINNSSSVKKLLMIKESELVSEQLFDFKQLVEKIDNYLTSNELPMPVLLYRRYILGENINGLIK